MKKNIFILSFLATVIMFAGCKKGDTGPQGPTGNANVLSAVYETSNWSSILADNVRTETTDLNVPEITQNIIASGAVLVYYGGSHLPISSWTALPYMFPLGSDNVSFGYGFAYSAGLVEINYYASDGLEPGNPGTQYFQIVIIEAIALAAHPNVDLKNFEEVKKEFNVQSSSLNIIPDN